MITYIVKLDTSKQSFSKEVLSEKIAEQMAREIWATFSSFGEPFTITVFQSIAKVTDGRLVYDLED